MTNALQTVPESPVFIDRALHTDPHLKSPHTRNQYRSNLEAFEAWRAGQGFTKVLVEAYAAHLQREGLAPATVNQKLASIRWYARKMVDFAFDYLEPEQAERVSKQAARVLTVEDVKGTSPQVGRHIKWTELKKLLRACVNDDSPAGLRDAALFALAWTTGLRRAELCGLTVADLTVHETQDPESDEIIQEADLTVRGKGGKARVAYLFNGQLEALLAWLEERGETPGPLFCHVSKSGRVFPERSFTGEGLRQIFLRRIKQTRSKGTTWHDFRRTFAGNLWDAGVDGATIQDLMGHANITTTANYDRRPERARREAVKKLTVPTFK